MTDLERQMREDRSLRDAAKSLFMADYENLRADLQQRGIGSRVADRVQESATDMFEDALEMADEHRGVVAALVGAIVLWIASNPILSLVFGDKHEDDADYCEHCEH